MIEVTEGAARLVLAPDIGGGIARLDVDGRPLLRPWAGDASDPFSLGCNVLVPFSNRISGGGFTFQDRFFPVAPNSHGPLPLHGDGFQKPWHLSGGSGLILQLPDGRIGPWVYRAEQRFDLSSRDLTVTLTITNTGAEALPFGGGFHPWFPRTRQTLLRFDAHTVWTEDASHLPVAEIDLQGVPDWQFQRLRTLPATWINNGFSRWQGAAQIQQGPAAVSCRLTASANLGTLIVYSQGTQDPTVCVEPVSHPVDAVNLPGMPGLVVLQPGETTVMWMRLSWDA